MPESKPVLVIIDDEPELVSLLELHFASRGYQVVTASTGREGILAVQRYGPDIVLLDLGLPDIGGLDVLQALRPLESGLKVFIVTASSDQLASVVAGKLGALEFIRKPFKLPALDAVVSEHLEARS